MDQKSCVVKRTSGKCEKYDERKVYASIYAACYVVLLSESKCENIAGQIARKISTLAQKRKKISSQQITAEVTRHLKTRNKHAAFMYETHRDVS